MVVLATAVQSQDGSEERSVRWLLDMQVLR